MTFEAVDVKTARERQSQGWTYVDVRSVEEFAQGHPEGSVNVPILFQGPFGMSPNPKFLQVMQRLYSTDTPLLLGCRSGARSARACELLASHGYTKLANVGGGFLGGPGEPGWAPSGLPSRTEPAPGTTWSELEGG
jgi:rhodanese-related sulfurtransferase